MSAPHRHRPLRAAAPAALSRLVAQLSWDRRGLLVRPERVRVAPREALATLTGWLYQRLFTGRQAPGKGAARAGAAWFVEQLGERAARATYLDEGFLVVGRSAAGVFVQKELRLWVEEPSALRPARARTGQRVAVRLPCAREGAVPGFFTVVSRRGRVPDTARFELHLNVTPHGAVELVDALLHAPALARARFEARLVDDPDGYGRRDSALLSVHPPSWPAVIRWLGGFYGAHHRHFRAGTAPLTLPLARGVGAAESPPGASIFGEHRCRLIARGVLHALRAQVPWPDTVARRFAQEGLRFDAPWLGLLSPGWVDRTRRSWL